MYALHTSDIYCIQSTDREIKFKQLGGTENINGVQKPDFSKNVNLSLGRLLNRDKNNIQIWVTDCRLKDTGRRGYKVQKENTEK